MHSEGVGICLAWKLFFFRYVLPFGTCTLPNHNNIIHRNALVTTRPSTFLTKCKPAANLKLHFITSQTLRCRWIYISHKHLFVGIWVSWKSSRLSCGPERPRVAIACLIETVRRPIVPHLVYPYIISYLKVSMKWSTGELHTRTVAEGPGIVLVPVPERAQRLEAEDRL